MTGVDWCQLTVSEVLLERVQTVRRNERRIAVMGEDVHARLVRETVTSEVGAASVLATQAQLDAEALFEQCFELKGRPFEEGPARRDMRERIRVYRRITQYGASVPRTLDELLDLWTEAMSGEVPLYRDAEVAQFRTSRVPFGHRGNPFESAPPIMGRETVDPARIPDETEAMLAFMQRTDLPPEIVAAATHFLCGHIHPFNDGNGHVARMLSCICLADSYSLTTIIALLRRLQDDRGTMNLVMAQTVQQKEDLADVVELFLEMLCAAQRDVLPEKAGFVRLPLRFVPTQDLELMSVHRKGREVFRGLDGRVIKVVADKRRLSRASAVFEAVSAAYEGSAAIAQPYELVCTAYGYAMVLEFVDGAPLSDLIVQGEVSPETAGAMMARCLSDLHALHGDPTRMRDVRKPFLSMVDNVALWLSEATVAVCKKSIRMIPASTTLVHGDVHMGNVFMRSCGSPVLIDADTISMGHPVFDLACTYSTLVCEAIVDSVRAESFHGVSTEITRAVWQSLVSCYFANARETRTAMMDRQIDMLAWLVLLNRLRTVVRADVPFGESAMQILQATSHLSKAVGCLEDA